MAKGLLINLDRCTGCNTCAMACKMQNNVPEGMLWNRVLTEGMISDTMLNAASNLVAGMSGPLFVICLLLIFFVLGFVVPSSSGLAVLAMPIFAPLADTVGIPRWIIVAAYQFGQYAMLYIAPTGLVMATLQMLDMKMSHWFKFVWPMMVFTLVFGAILLSICSVVFAV